MMSSFSEDQRRFMELAGQTIGRRNEHQADRYANHIHEEAKEMFDAWMVVDDVKAVDGAVDLIVVALGFLFSMGLDPSECWAAVHRANMSKVDGSLGPTVFRHDGQVGKPEGWIAPEREIERILRESKTR